MRFCALSFFVIYESPKRRESRKTCDFLLSRINNLQICLGAWPSQYSSGEANFTETPESDIIASYSERTIMSTAKPKNLVEFKAAKVNARPDDATAQNTAFSIVDLVNLLPQSIMRRVKVALAETIQGYR